MAYRFRTGLRSSHKSRTYKLQVRGAAVSLELISCRSAKQPKVQNLRKLEVYGNAEDSLSVAADQQASAYLRALKKDDKQGGQDHFGRTSLSLTINQTVGIIHYYLPPITLLFHCIAIPPVALQPQLLHFYAQSIALQVGPSQSLYMVGNLFLVILVQIQQSLRVVQRQRNPSLVAVLTSCSSDN